MAPLKESTGFFYKVQRESKAQGTPRAQYDEERRGRREATTCIPLPGFFWPVQALPCPVLICEALARAVWPCLPQTMLYISGAMCF